MNREKTFYLFFAAIIFASLFLRFYDLTIRPMHHDEGVIAWFRLNIYKQCFSPASFDLDTKTHLQRCSASYTYDPDYHGPLPILSGALIFLIFGIGDYTLRAPGCLLNGLTMLPLLFLRKELSDRGVLVASALLALSPSMVFYSHFAYSDNFHIFFCVCALVLAIKYIKERRNKWLYLLSADTALLFSIKESTFLFLFSMASYLGLKLLYSARKKKAKLSIPRITPRQARTFITASLIFAIVYAFFYSNMFTNFYSLQRGIEQSLLFWLSRSTSWKGHFKPFDYFLGIFVKYEPAVLILSVLSLLALRKPFAGLCAWWSLSTLLIYSAIPYKTPWLDINMILPMALLSGCGASYYLTKFRGWKRASIASLILILLAYSAHTAWQVTYVQYANPSNTLVYVAGTDDYKRMILDIEEKADSLSGKQTPVLIRLESYWPLPWTLRDYKIGYGGGQTSQPIVISEKGDYSDILPDVRSKYLPPVKYEMRQGMYVYVYYKTAGAE